ncbi:hypothetical protein K488DRAFT_92592 [Vararia minispora EC-137]|uniref:Uncharacterized protein n=1 Tax=Vararia minispora EC-137 TaxID=1314806 RepID=A0ACB8Q3W6_9AGAM|nr:hypothetical protein K488DRAFT_92592 [Vararia minispora EC-137]
MKIGGSSGLLFLASKWLRERIVDLGLPHAAIVWLGQFPGDATGNWTKTEWFPPFVHAGERIGCLQRIDGVRASVSPPPPPADPATQDIS